MTEETAGTPRVDVDKALEARQDASDCAKRISEDGYSEPARIILNALTLLDSAVIALEREVAALTTQRDELQKRNGYTAVPVAEGGANIDALWTAIKEVSDNNPSLSHGDPRSFNGISIENAIKEELATGTATATALPTNGTEGLRAELDAAKRALAEEQAKNESLRDALVYSGFMQHGTQQYMLPVGIGLLNNDWVVVTFPDKSKVDTGPRPRAFEMMRAALAAKSTEQKE